MVLVMLQQMCYADVATLPWKHCPVQFTTHSAISTSAREIQGDSDNGTETRNNYFVANVVDNFPLS